MIRVSVAGIGVDPRNSQPIVVLNDETGQRGLPIWIGALEARAISLLLMNVKSRRPMTHELLDNVIASLGYRVEQVEIDRHSETTYKATIRLVPVISGEIKLVDSRASDAIALALSVGAPIFVADDLEFVLPASEEEEQKEDEEFKEFVARVKASDFTLREEPPLLTDPDASDESEP